VPIIKKGFPLLHRKVIPVYFENREKHAKQSMKEVQQSNALSETLAR
jgi:hypothetical protein